jgi:hypothetical protein
MATKKNTKVQEVELYDDTNANEKISIVFSQTYLPYNKGRQYNFSRKAAAKFIAANIAEEVKAIKKEQPKEKK